MKNITKELSDIIKYYPYTEDDIYKGRAFGTLGEYQATTIIYNKMNYFTSNLTLVTNPTKERIGDEDSGQFTVMKHINDKMTTTGYDVALKNGEYGTPIVIPNNESFPFPCKIQDNTETTGTNGYVRVLSLEEAFPRWANYIKTGNFSEVFKIRFSGLKLTPIGDGELLYTEELAYYENYSNVTSEEAEGKIHLINPASIQEYNETLQTLTELNASGFIIPYNLVDNIKGYSTDIPGAALSANNWTQIKNLTLNETVGIEPSNPDETTAYGTYKGNLTELSIDVFSYNHTNPQEPILDGAVAYLINSSGIDKTWYDFQKFNNMFANILAVCSGYRKCAGFIFYDNTHPDSHFNNPTSRFFLSGYRSYLSGSQYSWVKHPSMSINGSILVNGQMTDVETWVENNEIYVDFSIDQQKDPAVESYNVYCDVQGVDTSRTVIFSGGHHDGWWGQMSIDNAVGPAIMLGILKYYNDNKIIPPCNIRFISHGGEEYWDRGSISHVFNPDNFDVLEDTSYIINLDQLCHNFPGSLLRINCSDDDVRTNVYDIVNQTNYSKHFPGDNATVKGEVSTNVDCRPYYDYKDMHGSSGVKIDHINFCNNEFPTYHLSGRNHSTGDAMDIFDWHDLNITAEVILNVTEYVLTVDKPQTGVAPLSSMVVTPGSFDFGVLPVNVTNATTFEVRNDGIGVLGYVVDEDCSWIKVTPISGSSYGESDPIDVEINTSGLSIGEHSYNISILADDCSEVFTISVRVVDSDSPILSYSPTSHNFSDIMEGLTNSTTFEIWNSGEATLNYTLNENCSWLMVDPTFGSSSGEHDTVTVTVNSTGLSPDKYHGTIQIISENYSEFFIVDMEVIENPAGAGGVDQQQTVYTNDYALMQSQSSCAQSFIPNVSSLERIDLYLGKVGSPLFGVTVSVRSLLTGSDIASVTLSASEITSAMSWMSVNFSNVTLSIGSRYYIVVSSPGTFSEYYKVGYAGSGDLYTDGFMYQYNSFGGIIVDPKLVSRGGGIVLPQWQILMSSDLCFKTYGGRCIP